MTEATTTTPAQETAAEPPPPFDPDPDLVADIENNPFAIRASRKAATEAHEAAVRERSGIA